MQVPMDKATTGNVLHLLDQSTIRLFLIICVTCLLTMIVALIVLRFISKLDCDLVTYLYSIYASHPEKKLRNKVIWISGACSGIGEQLAYDLAAIGAKLVLSGHLDNLQAVKEKCIKVSAGKLTDEDILPLPPFDIRDFQLHKQMVDTVVSYFDRIDVMINNVGRSQRATFEEITVDEDREIFDINVFGQISLSRIVMGQFVKQGFGHFVVTSSVAGKFGAPFSASYTASKHALAGYFECIRCEAFTKGIRVTTICPGPVLTTLIKNSFHSESFLDEVNQSTNLADGKLSVQRCSQLMLVAIAHKLQESWISLKPILWFCYCYQYLPDISKYIMVRYFPPDKLYKMRKGESNRNGVVVEQILRKTSRALSLSNNNFPSQKSRCSSENLTQLISEHSPVELN